MVNSSIELTVLFDDFNAAISQGTLTLLGKV